MCRAVPRLGSGAGGREIAPGDATTISRPWPAAGTLEPMAGGLVAVARKVGDACRVRFFR